MDEKYLGVIIYGIKNIRVFKLITGRPREIDCEILSVTESSWWEMKMR